MPRKPEKRRPASIQDEMVVGALRGAGRPVSAYEIIDSLRHQAVLAPQTVYRSLDRLIADGRAHRLESLNAFVACSHVAHAGTALFAICESCGGVTEFEDAEVVARLGVWAGQRAFKLAKTTLELRGTCAECIASASRKS